jgi:hypothetical protein
LPYGVNPNGIIVADDEVELKIPVSPEQKVIGLVVTNETDVDLYVYDDHTTILHATRVLAGKVRRYEFDHVERRNALQVKLKAPGASTGTVLVELE